MYANPYADQSFFGFFGVLLSRIWQGARGLLSFSDLAADEVQILVLVCLAISGGVVGVFLVLKRMTMLANALSHTILLGIVAAYLLCHALTLPIMMGAALLTALATAFLTGFLSRVIKLQEDASIGLVFSLFFALGIVLLTLFSRNVHIGTELVMGNVDTLKPSDIKAVATILAINLALLCLFYHGFKITTFDPALARSFGFSPLFFHYLLMVQASMTTIGAFRAVGVLMIMAFFVLPPLTARLLTHRLLSLLVWAGALGVAAALAGVALSRHLLTFYGVGLSTSGLVVTLLGLLYLLIALTSRLRRKRLLPAAQNQPASQLVFPVDKIEPEWGEKSSACSFDCTGSEESI